jgi:hypothetical protein
MKLTDHQHDLQIECAKLSLHASEDIQRALTSTRAVIAAFSHYLEATEDPEERKAWQTLWTAWTMAHDRLRTTIEELREVP